MWSIVFRRCRDALAALGALFVLVAFTPLAPWWATALAGPWTDPVGGTLIVLTAESLGNGVIGDSSYLRASYAVRAYQAGGFERILITGDRDTSTEMAHFISASGVPPDRIVLETESHSTHDSALNTAAVLAQENSAKPAVLLTSDYHMWRAARAFRRAGVTLKTRPIPDCLKRGTRWTGRWDAFQDLVVESAKIGYYWSKGWI